MECSKLNHLVQWLNDTFPVWYAIRAAGLTAYVLLFMSVVSGVLQSLPLIRGPRRGMLYAFHCTTCWYGWVFGMAHGVLLLLDNKVNYTLTDILIPFTTHYLPLQTAFGIVAFYILSILVLSSWAIKRVGRKFWRAIHFLAFPGYLFALYHGVSLGTDSPYPEIKLLYVLTGAIVFALVLVRLSVRSTNSKDRAPVRPRRRPKPRPVRVRGDGWPNWLEGPGPPGG